MLVYHYLSLRRHQRPWPSNRYKPCKWQWARMSCSYQGPYLGTRRWSATKQCRSKVAAQPHLLSAKFASLVSHTGHVLACEQGQPQEWLRSGRWASSSSQTSCQAPLACSWQRWPCWRAQGYLSPIPSEWGPPRSDSDQCRPKRHWTRSRWTHTRSKSVRTQAKVPIQGIPWLVVLLTVARSQGSRSFLWAQVLVHASGHDLFRSIFEKSLCCFLLVGGLVLLLLCLSRCICWWWSRLQPCLCCL